MHVFIVIGIFTLHHHKNDIPFVIFNKKGYLEKAREVVASDAAMLPHINDTLLSYHKMGSLHFPIS